jgi:hypothetical protein
LLLIFISYVWPLVLYKILVQIFKIISCDTIFFSDKINNNKIYDNYKKQLRQIGKRNSKIQ